MHCEHQNGCGFYKYLASRGKLVDGTCGKEDVEVCPRYREASGDHISNAEKSILRLKPNQSIYKHEEALTHEETVIAFKGY